MKKPAKQNVPTVSHPRDGSSCRSFDWYQRNFWRSSYIPPESYCPRAKETRLAWLLKHPSFVEMTSPPLELMAVDYLRRLRSYYRQLPAASRWQPPKAYPQLQGRLLGIEIEYYPNGETPPETNLLSVVHDGSLDAHGREVRKITWADRSGQLPGVSGLRLKGRVNCTCGYHVHVDVRHLPGRETRDTLLFSADETYDRIVVGFYRHLKRLVPRSRLNNKFCLWVGNRPLSPVAGHNSTRYCAVNYQSLAKHGTLEFRCQGNFDPEHGRPGPGLLNTQAYATWALICQAIVAWASDRCRELPDTWEEFLRGLRSDLATWCLLRQSTLRGLPVDVSDSATCV